ncbi:MAG: hypothetical protein ABS36_06900 [Acidobacteria bacterium SCN 69-37]|nr:MAG: hypothetical protein ABS36_06900 [Acidobacteria bacterium SCN 69-37]
MLIACLVYDAADPPAPHGAIEQVARAVSPRVTPCGRAAVVCDVSGLGRVCGPPAVVAREVLAQAAAAGLPVRLALAGTMTTAWVLAHARAGLTLGAVGTDAAMLAPLPLTHLLAITELDRHVAGVRRHTEAAVAIRTAADHRPVRRSSKSGGGSPGTSTPGDASFRSYRDRLATLERWGIDTCGALAALSRADVRARLGASGVRLHQAACGEDVVPLVPIAQAREFVDRIELEWPIEGLEPLSFVLARQCDRLARHLEQADRGAVAIRTTLTLTTRAHHVRTLALPAPIRDAKVLRTLILLDLESHPPDAGIDVVDLQLDVVPGRIVQGSLLARATPSPERVSTLLARLTALCGEGRVGSPVVLDTHDGRACGLAPFLPPSSGSTVTEPILAAEAREAMQSAAMTGFSTVTEPILAAEAGPGERAPVPAHLRRWRRPRPVQVEVARGRPAQVAWFTPHDRAMAVRACAGPWRTSGAWWDTDAAATWDRDEWDVELADGLVYRLARHRGTGAWEAEGVFD